jgi:hypothetical protein
VPAPALAFALADADFAATLLLAPSEYLRPGVAAADGGVALEGRESAGRAANGIDMLRAAKSAAALWPPLDAGFWVVVATMDVVLCSLRGAHPTCVRYHLLHASGTTQHQARLDQSRYADIIAFTPV